jgi:hypothetical protein
MLKTRNVIIAVIALTSISLLLMIADLLKPPDSGGLGRDSYGTRAQGHRAIFELLERLDIPVERSLVPPSGLFKRDLCIVFWNPDPAMVRTEPDYLRKAGDWMREGGTVVVAATAETTGKPQSPFTMLPSEFTVEKTPFELLGLEGVRLERSATGEDAGLTEARPPGRRGMGRGRLRPPPALDLFSIQAEGALAHMADTVGRIALPRASHQVLDMATTQTPAGRIYFETPDGDERAIAALFECGRGRALVISDPALAQNFALGRADNAILTAHLLGLSGQPVVFDEFYHGLTIRGNPFWLAKQWPYSLLLVLLLAACIVWVWRSAITLGPPLAETTAPRRSILEYVEAMSVLFDQRHCRRFVLKEVRSGTIWALRKKMQLPLQRDTLEATLQALRRSHPEAAENLRQAAGRVDAVLRQGATIQKQEHIEAARKMSACLSRNYTQRFVRKSNV